MTRRLHQIWIQGAPPERFCPSRDRWRSLNAGAELETWADPQIRRLIREDWGNPALRFYDGLRLPVQRSDLGRLAILWRHGGIYLDLDFVPLRPIPPALWEWSASKLVVSESGLRFGFGRLVTAGVHTAFVGSPPEHPFFAALIEEILRLRPRYSHSVNYTTGPGVFNRVFWREGFHLRSDVEILDSSLLFGRSYVLNPTRILQKGSWRRAQAKAPIAVHEFRMEWHRWGTTRRLLYWSPLVASTGAALLALLLGWEATALVSGGGLLAASPFVRVKVRDTDGDDDSRVRYR